LHNVSKPEDLLSLHAVDIIFTVPCWWKMRL